MAGISNYLKALYLNWYFRDQAVTKPADVYVRIMRVLPNDAGTGGTEITGTGYAPEAVPTTDAGWTAPVQGTGTQWTITNAAIVDFGTPGSDWAPAGQEAVGVTIWDASSGGNYVGSSTFPAPKVFQSGDPVSFPIGDLKVTLAGA
jgi:hypothetical protein